MSVSRRIIRRRSTMQSSAGKIVCSISSPSYSIPLEKVIFAPAYQILAIGGVFQIVKGSVSRLASETPSLHGIITAITANAHPFEPGDD